MKHIMILLMTLIASVSQGDNRDFGLPPVDLRQGQIITGNIFNLIVLPYDGKTVFYVLGREAAEVRMSNLQLRLFIGQRQFDLPLKRDLGGFVYEESFNPNESKLEISAPNQNSETIYLKGHP